MINMVFVLASCFYFVEPKFCKIKQMHFVVFLSKSILANSFGEWILENMYVLPIEMHGAFKISTKGNIGPVPALDTLRIEVPKDLSASILNLRDKRQRRVSSSCSLSMIYLNLNVRKSI